MSANFPNGINVSGGSITSPGGSLSEEFGASASATGTSAVALGNGAANLLSSNSIVVGAGSSLSSGAHQTVVVGAASSCASTNAIVIGYNLTGAGVASVVIGSSITCTAAGAVVIGSSCDVGNNNGCIAIGQGATATGAGQLVFDSTTYGLTDAFFGGSVKASPAAFTLHASGGSGTDVAGANLVIAAGRPTGSGAGGSLLFQTAQAGVTGTAPRALNTVLTLDQNLLATFARDVSIGRHLLTAGTTPGKSAGTGAGTGPTTSVTGNDSAGLIAVTTGTTPAASANVLTVTFVTAFGSAPKAVILTPANAATAALTGNAAVYVSSVGTSTFVIAVGSTALAASTAYQWYYTVIG